MTTVSATAVKALSLTTYNPNDPVAGVPQYSVFSNIINPATIPKWQNELPNLAHPANVHTPDTLTYPSTDYYKLDVKQIKAQVLPAGFPSTPVLAYGDPTRPDTYSYPAHTILARSTQASVNAGLGKVSYSNGNLALANPALFPPVDITIHGNNMGEPALRTVAHLHGAKINNQASDGYPEAWSSPLLPNTIPMPSSPTIPYNPNPFDYTNTQESTMLWYHDHTLGMTHGNVYAGLAGAYLVRDDNEVSMMTNTTTAKKLPHPNYEIPLVFQDRMFRTNGSFAYPDSLNPTLFPSAPPVSVVPEFFGQVMVVN
jgi:spore coat protein A, manganese oxidase